MYEDIIAYVLTILWIAMWGGFLVGFVYFRSYNPYWPRKYYDVAIKDSEKKLRKRTKGWYCKEGKVEYFRVVMTGIRGSFKGVNFDRSWGKCIDDSGEISIIEQVPNKYDAGNYAPEFPPLTQREKFEKEVADNVLTPLCTVEYKDGEETKTGVDKNAFEIARLRIKEILNANSRMIDSEESGWLKENIATARRQRERGAGDDWIQKYGPMVIMIAAIVFCYLMIDGSLKSFQSAMDKTLALNENIAKQMVESRGGTYTPIMLPQANTSSSNNIIPFVQK